MAQPPKRSGVSTRQTVPTQPSRPPSEDEMYRIPMDQLRELANKQLRESNN